MKTVDQIYHCQILGQALEEWQLECRLRIFQPQPHIEVQTVMITDMGFELGWFIPHVAESLIEHIVSDFHLNPVKLVWVEHYTPDFRRSTWEDFSQVVFEWQKGKAGNLRWFPLPPQIALALFSEDFQLLSTQESAARERVWLNSAGQSPTPLGRVRFERHRSPLP